MLRSRKCQLYITVNTINGESVTKGFTSHGTVHPDESAEQPSILKCCCRQVTALMSKDGAELS
ncbi:hypothetical protein J6590_092168 [Homalodisca vitripennis]|nr:hypothetical protein J6590_092168 [Homalodisca vitripennis]